MSRTLFILLILSPGAGICGCFTTHIVAPAHSGNYVLGTSEQQTVTKVKSRSWYMFWGLLPISNHSSGEVVKRLPSGYRIVRLKASLDATSFFVALFTAGLVSSAVIVAEGVAPPMAPGEETKKPIPATLPP
jgi:hypothetical protein